MHCPQYKFEISKTISSLVSNVRISKKLKKQKKYLAQTMGPNVLYSHKKNWEDPSSCFGVKSKELRKKPF